MSIKVKCPFAVFIKFIVDKRTPSYMEQAVALREIETNYHYWNCRFNISGCSNYDCYKKYCKTDGTIKAEPVDSKPMADACKPFTDWIKCGCGRMYNPETKMVFCHQCGKRIRETNDACKPVEIDKHNPPELYRHIRGNIRMSCRDYWDKFQEGVCSKEILIDKLADSMFSMMTEAIAQTKASARIDGDKLDEIADDIKTATETDPILYGARESGLCKDYINILMGAIKAKSNELIKWDMRRIK